MLSIFKPRYIPPDRKTIASNHIPALYNVRGNIAKQMTNDVNFFSITTDLWSPQAKQSYIAVKIHYLTRSFKMRSHLIETKEFAEAHTWRNNIRSFGANSVDWS